MNKVVFPSLNLEFNLSPIALQIGSARIYWYAIFIVSGIILSLVLTYFSKKKYALKYDDFLELFTFALIGGIVGARLFYVAFNFEYYYKNISEIINIKNGGLAIFGGIIFGMITLYIECKLKKINFLDVCDFIAPYLALTQGIGRIGNFVNCEAYGVQTTSFFRMGLELEGKYIEVHPCFLYEMIGCFAIFAILKFIQTRQSYEGEIVNFYFIFYGIIRFFIEGLRADSLMIGSLKVSQIIAITFMVLGIFSYIKNTKCRKMSTKK